ncbi:membrane transport protein [Clostridium acetireducens DSM 10703]|jgi:auxin efflux carrier (AEC)|uniref:Membrane transport protein n=1 Tax=Clostridium acetireducens DSM 10703 TaxID=1121290 RepID=A0A1E8EXM3_9CLOT|nr:AEC family transporter [Clostridium acetireducens]OFI05557.1 membrane transport protein [Clostridium acetireducens DSM 10703]
MIVLNAVESIFSIGIMISIGYVLTLKGWLNEEISKVFSKLVINISLPSLMIYDLMKSFDRNKLFHLATGLIVPFCSIALCYILAILVSKIFKIKLGRIGIFRSMFFVSNTIFIGLPVNLALFGEKSIPYVLLYYIANTSFFWTIGAYGISKDGNSKAENIFSKETLKRILSPPLMGFILAIILILLNIKLPKFIMDSCKYLGNLTTPLSMLFIGITIYYVNLKDIKIDKDMIILLIGRFLISPLTVIIVSYFYTIPDLMRKVFIIQSAMPAMTNTAIIAKAYNADYKYATVMTVVTTILSLFIIPLYMLVN